MAGLAAALVESGKREEDEKDSNILWHWSVLNLLSASFFTAYISPLSSTRKILPKTFLDIAEGQFLFLFLPLFLCFFVTILLTAFLIFQIFSIQDNFQIGKS